jgi:hypothetical protein
MPLVLRLHATGGSLHDCRALNVNHLLNDNGRGISPWEGCSIYW